MILLKKEVKIKMENEVKEKKKTNSIVKILAIIGGVFVAIIAMIFIAFAVIKSSSNRIECTSKGKSLTVYFNNETITGYSAKNVNFNIDTAKNTVSSSGIDNYVKTLQTWYETYVGGKCTITRK